MHLTNPTTTTWLLTSVVVIVVSFETELGLASHPELDQAHLKISRLQSLLERTTRDVDARRLHLAACENMIPEMDNHIVLLLNSSKINALEEEVRDLWASLRKSNFELHLLESRKREAEESLAMLESQFRKMADVVTEQWIQIQQFEQALQLTQMRVLKAKGLAPTPLSALLKLTNELSRMCLPKSIGLSNSQFSAGVATFRDFISQTLQWLERFYSSVKKFHHELQGRIRKEMESHELTANFANKEFIFLVVSAMIVFPVLGAWMLISSQLT